MFVTRRRFNNEKNHARVCHKVAKFALDEWGKQIRDTKKANEDCDLAETLLSLNQRHLAAAESALDEKERTIEKLQDDLYRMHDHLMYVREVMTDLP